MPVPSPPEGLQIRIAVLNFAHETVTFLPNDTTLADFVYDGSPTRGEALLAWEPRSYMGGFVKVAREHADVELVMGRAICDWLGWKR